MPLPGKKEYTRIFELFTNQSWLRTADREEAFWELVDNCKHEQEKELILDLLERFTYIASSSLESHFDELVSCAFSNWKLPPERTLIAASHPGNDPDSAQWLVHMLKPVVARQGFEKVKLVNKLGGVSKFCRDRPYIVVVDEFIGTGNTFSSRLRHVTNDVRAEYMKHGDGFNFQVFGLVLASTFEGLVKLESEGFRVESALVIEKGISDFYPGNLVQRRIAAMLDLESNLQREVDGVPLPTLGWGFAEALYAVELLNIPNSVFPVFWWKFAADGRRRKTLFHRLM